MKKILLSARDPAAALHIGQLYLHWKSFREVSLRIVAQSPAYEILLSLGVEAQHIKELKSTMLGCPKAQAILKKAQQVLSEFQPDMVLVGLSAPGEGGIDEALLAQAKCPTFMFQDFWGETNDFFGSNADHIFCLDKNAQEMTTKAHNIPCTVIGSPKHIPFAQLNPDQLKVQLRAKYKLSPEDKVVVFFGQCLHHLTGYRETQLQILHSLSQLKHIQIKCFFRSHPRDDLATRTQDQKFLKDQKLSQIDLSELSHEEQIVLADACISLFSNSLLDTAYINFYSKSYFRTPLALLFNSEIRDFLSGLVNNTDIPYFKNNLAQPIIDANSLTRALETSLTVESASAFGKSAKAFLKDPLSAPQTAFEHLLTLCASHPLNL